MHWIQRLYNSNTEGQRFNLFTFFCLYIAQSLPMTFFSTALQVTMRQASFSLSAIAILQLIKLPWVLKFLWSPIVDRQCNTMKGFRRCIFISEGAYAAIILFVGHLDLHEDFYFILTLIVMSFVASATQDIATDALAVLTFKKKDKGLVNSMQSLGSFAATLIGSGFLLVLLQKYGWHYILPFMSIFVIIAIIPLWRNKSLKITPQPASEPVSKADFIWFFTRKSIWRQIGFLSLYYAGIIGSLSMFRPYLVDLGYSMQQIGWMSGVAGSLAACVASLASGQLISHLGRFAARRIAAVCSLFAMMYLFAITNDAPTYPFILTGLIFVWFCYGMSSVVVYTTAMDNVRVGREGTDFTVQTVITHISGLLISMLSGKVADLCGYHYLFLFETMLALFSVVYVFMMFKKDK